MQSRSNACRIHGYLTNLVIRYDRLQYKLLRELLKELLKNIGDLWRRLHKPNYVMFRLHFEFLLKELLKSMDHLWRRLHKPMYSMFRLYFDYIFLLFSPLCSINRPGRPIFTVLYCTVLTLMPTLPHPAVYYNIHINIHSNQYNINININPFNINININIISIFYQYNINIISISLSK